jgi:hypothetical protein
MVLWGFKNVDVMGAPLQLGVSSNIQHVYYDDVCIDTLVTSNLCVWSWFFIFCFPEISLPFGDHRKLLK